MLHNDFGCFVCLVACMPTLNELLRIKITVVGLSSPINVGAGCTVSRDASSRCSHGLMYASGGFFAWRVRLFFGGWHHYRPLWEGQIVSMS